MMDNAAEAVVEDIYSLTPLQQGMLFHGLYALDSTDYWEQLCIAFSGDLDAAAFRRSWRQVIAHHGVLRTHFHWEELDEPLQVVQPTVEVPWEEEDWRTLSAGEFDDRFRQLLAADRQRGFEFSQPPLMRFYLLRGAGNRSMFLWSHHHILLDGWSVGIVFRDVVTCYRAYVRGDAVRLSRPRPFRDYLLWLQDQETETSKAFWRDHLSEVDGPKRILAGELTRRHQTEPSCHAQQIRSLPQSAANSLQLFLRRERLTLNTVVQGAWSLLLSHYTNDFDVVYATVVSGRPPTLHGAEDMVGLLINTIPVRVVLDPTSEVRPWLSGLQKAQVERDRHTYISLADILSSCGFPPETPLFETILSVENYPVDTMLSGDASFRIEQFDAFEQTNYPLAVVVSPGDGALTLKITADTRRFNQAVLSRMLTHFADLIVAIIENPDAKLSDLVLEKTDTAAAATASHLSDQTVHQAFERQALRTPEAEAVIAGSESLTYRQLNEASNRLARYLIDQGAGADDLIGICSDRSLEMVVALLGVLKAGSAYLPLDPGYPIERLRFMLLDASLRFVMVDKSVSSWLRDGFTAGSSSTTRVVDLNMGLDSYPADDLPAVPVSADSLAYVIYTSGSTGSPKGVMISHGALLNHMHWMIDAFHFDNSVRVLQKTPFSFDASVWEFFLPLMCGGSLVLARPGGHTDPDYLIETIRERRITVLQGVPSLLGSLAAHEEFTYVNSLTHVFSGGEVLSKSVWRRLRDRTSAIICNLYGPTEACIDATFHVCDSVADDPIPIGRPIANTFARLRNIWGHEAPVGIAGELWLGGSGLARGYWNQPALTDDRFIHDPTDGARVYRTGDMVRRRKDGALDFIVRFDDQVKLRGHRIELGEVEGILEQLPSVGRVVVVISESDSDRAQLTAYVVPAGRQEGIEETLRQHARQTLPSYMLPTNIVVLDQLPKSPSGKIDRRQLADRSILSSLRTGDEALRTETERQVAAIWAEVLNLEKIGPADNFFHLGGHSLTAMQVVSRIRDTFKIKLPLRTLFDLPTIANLAGRIDTHRVAQSAASASASGSAGGEDTEEVLL